MKAADASIRRMQRPGPCENHTALSAVACGLQASDADSAEQRRPRATNAFVPSKERRCQLVQMSEVHKTAVGRSEQRLPSVSADVFDAVDESFC